MSFRKRNLRQIILLENSQSFRFGMLIYTYKDLGKFVEKERKMEIGGEYL